MIHFICQHNYQNKDVKHYQVPGYAVTGSKTSFQNTQPVIKVSIFIICTCLLTILIFWYTSNTLIDRRMNSHICAIATQMKSKLLNVSSILQALSLILTLKLPLKLTLTIILTLTLTNLNTNPIQLFYAFFEHRPMIFKLANTFKNRIDNSGQMTKRLLYDHSTDLHGIGNCRIVF